MSDQRLSLDKNEIIVAILMCLMLLMTTIFLDYSANATQTIITNNNRRPILFNPYRNSKKFRRALYNTPKIESDYKASVNSSGLAQVISRINTTKPVVFLTIDDGGHKSLDDIKMLVDNNIKASLFLAKPFIENNADFFSEFPSRYFYIENHSIGHRLDLYRLTYQQQKDEICGGADYLYSTYKKHSTLFRPPGGVYTSDTLKAAKDCGMQSVVVWTARSENGRMEYQDTDKLKPGDIVLMHFRPSFKDDLQAFIDAKNAAGLQSELLEDWMR